MMTTTVIDLDNLISLLNDQILANLLRQLRQLATARERLLTLEDWCADGTPELWYNDYFSILPAEFRLRSDVAQLQDNICQLRVNVQHFTKYLAAVAIDPLLRLELRLLTTTVAK
jgi:hypothetical protein